MIPLSEINRIINKAVDECGGDEDLAVLVLAEKARKEPKFLQAVQFWEKQIEPETVH